MNQMNIPAHRHEDLALQSGIVSARARSLQWLGQLQASGQPAGVSLISAAHDANQWPGML
jgi:hypothetical protein